MLDYGLDPQEALNTLRFSVGLDGTVALEEGVSAEVANGLARRGHAVGVVGGFPRTAFGGGQVIERDAETGVLRGGSEPRKDGIAVGW